ncbi:MAG: 50S ribosomal protein L28 [Anaerolineae bacterium]|nr:50S ribosomal protein L28 [Anaerolineae bacterium]
MAKCDICGKGPQFGHHVSHSKHRTKRRWAPNIQRVTIIVNGQRKKVNMCTRCLRTRNKHLAQQ